MRGIAAGLIQIMQHRRQGVTLRAVELAQQLEQIDLMADIKPGRRFIQQHNGGLLCQHHCDPRSLTLAAGKRVHALPGKVGNARCLHRAVHRVCIFLAPAGKQRLVRIASA